MLVLDVQRCIRCGEPHIGLRARGMDTPARGGETHMAHCPVTGVPMPFKVGFEPVDGQPNTFTLYAIGVESPLTEGREK